MIIGISMNTWTTKETYRENIIHHGSSNTTKIKKPKKECDSGKEENTNANNPHQPQSQEGLVGYLGL